MQYSDKLKKVCINKGVNGTDLGSTLNICICDGGIITIPVPYNVDGVEYIKMNGVERPTCRYGIEFKMSNTNTCNVIIDFETYMQYILFERMDITGVGKSAVSVYDAVTKATSRRDDNYVPSLIRQTQRFIDEVIGKLPLNKTSMNSWAVNKRIAFIDPKFDEIVDPNKKLAYQINKSERYFDKGWTLMGLSDSNLADCNYIFTDDLRKYTPFGIKHHNPQRNLYQTLGMKGDELPAVRSRSQDNLIKQNICRKGWNVPTLFIDIPLTFEDQILIHRESWEKRYIKVKSVINIYGECFVRKGAILSTGEVIGQHLDGKAAVFNMDGEKHEVVEVTKRNMTTGTKDYPMYSVTVDTTRYFKEGHKLTNAHGNKGVVRMFDDGYVIHDPVKGDITPEVIVSFRSIKKRKNFGQVWEALVSRIKDPTEDNPVILPDDFECSEELILSRLRDIGYECELVTVDTPYGELKAIWGNVFWGGIKTAEENVWDFDDIKAVDNKGTHKIGLKFSHMEIRSLITTFGSNNGIVKEVLNEARGSDYLKSKITALVYNYDNALLPHIKHTDLKTIDPTTGVMHDEKVFEGTVADENVYPDGAIVSIPTVEIQVKEVSGDTKTVHINSIYLTIASARKCWQHKSGLKAVDTVTIALNNVIHYSITGDTRVKYWVEQYYNALTSSLGSKTGEIASLGMSIRYPKSIKATAVVSDTLPKNTVEIHTSMAEFLNIRTGDPVLVERFPCLGFMSLRAQYVKVTDDPDCRYTIRASNNCLVSQNLDFDGDTLFIASFESEEAHNDLLKVLTDNTLYVNSVIERMNNKKRPTISGGGFNDLNMFVHPVLTKEAHTKIVGRAVGVKAHTGPVIALAYNLMRISETKIDYSDMRTNVDIEVMLDFLGNTVFSQKHGVTPLHEKAVDAICTGDVDAMVSCGFDRTTSDRIISIVKDYARSLGVIDLCKYHSGSKETGSSNIINRIVRTYNKVYFASRAIQKPGSMYDYVNSSAVDVPSHLFRKIISKTNIKN